MPSQSQPPEDRDVTLSIDLTRPTDRPEDCSTVVVEIPDSELAAAERHMGTEGIERHLRDALEDLPEGDA